MRPLLEGRQTGQHPRNRPSLFSFYVPLNRKYELLAIVNPSLEETVRKELVAFIEAELSARATIVKNDQWGERKLAYKIHASDKGFYVLYELETEAQDIVQQLSKAFNLKKDIWRYMFTAAQDVGVVATPAK